MRIRIGVLVTVAAAILLSIALLSNSTSGPWRTLSISGSGELVSGCSSIEHCVGVLPVANGFKVYQFGRGGIIGSFVSSTLNFAFREGTVIAVTCASPTECFALGVTRQERWKIVRTTDGGMDWKPGVNSSLTEAPLGLACPTVSDCLAVGLAVYSTKDAGRIWSTSPAPQGDFGLTACLSISLCIGASLPTVFPSFVDTSRNLGSSWDLLYSGSRKLETLNAACSQSDCMIALGRPPSVLSLQPFPKLEFLWIRSVSGQLTVRLDATNIVGNVLGATCTGPETCAFASYSGGASYKIFWTSNLGASWSSIGVPKSVSVVNFTYCSAARYCIATARTQTGDEILIGQRPLN